MIERFDGQGLIGDNAMKEDDEGALKDYFQNHDDDLDRELMHEAARCGAIKCFRFLKINGVKIDAKTVECACEGGNEEIIQMCEEEGVDFGDGVIGALRGWKMKVAKWLVEVKGVHVDIDRVKKAIRESQNWVGWRMFRDEVKVEDLFYSGWMIADGEGSGILDEMSTAQLNKLLINLVTNTDRFEGVQVLIQHGADPNSEEKSRAIILASFFGHTEIVKELIGHGADPNLKDRYGNFAIILASSEGHSETVKVLLENGADPNSKDRDGLTAMFHACSTGYTEVVKILLEYGADPNVNHFNGCPAIVRAARNGHAETVKVLLEHGLDPNSEDEYSYPALILATKNGFADTVRALLQHGADPNLKDSQGETALTQAWSTKIVKLLLEHGADPNLKNKDGEPPIILAAIKARREVVEMLLEHGADPNAKNKFGETAIMFAAYNDLETVKALLEHGADPN